MINHDLKCIFIHIPRTAGSSLTTAISQQKKEGQRFDRTTRDKNQPKKIHYTVEQAKKTFGMSTLPSHSSEIRGTDSFLSINGDLPRVRRMLMTESLPSG